MDQVVSATMAVAAAAALALAVPAEANADAPFGSIAYSPSTGAVGWGTGPTWQTAQDAAYAQCTAANANSFDCTAGSNATPGGCMAVIARGEAWEMGGGATKDEAIQVANQRLGGAPGQVVSAQYV